MLEQFFILSDRGDTIITKAFRGELNRKECEIFFRKVKFNQSSTPVFHVDGVNFYFTKKYGMYFVLTSKELISPSFVFDALYRTMKVFRDYLGVLNEEGIRKNFILIYEIIDELFDYGYPQIMSTEVVKEFVINEAVVVAKTPSGSKPSLWNKNTVSSTAVTRPVSSTLSTKKKSKKEEIFVDIFDKITVLFNSNGFVINSAIDGVIQMKSYLVGNPELRLALNDNLIIGGSGEMGKAAIYDCSFYECVDSTNFENTKTLTINPPDGEFLVMNYRINGEFQTPFRIYTFIDEVNSFQLQMTLKIRATFPADHYAKNVEVKFPVPKSTSSVSFEMAKAQAGTYTADYNKADNSAKWVIKTFQGAREYSLTSKISLSSQADNTTRKEIGPISMNFDIHMFNVSGVTVKYLKIAGSTSKSGPHRWVRYVTQSSSYVCRT